MSEKTVTNPDAGGLALLVQAAEHLRAEDEKDNANGKRSKVVQSNNSSKTGTGYVRWNAGVNTLERIIASDVTKSPRITGKPKLDESTSAISVFQQALMSIKHLESLKDAKIADLQIARSKNESTATEIAKIEKEIILLNEDNPKIQQHLKFIKNCAKVTASTDIESELNERGKRKRCDSDIFGERPPSFTLRPGKRRPKWIETRPHIVSLDPVTINETNRRRERFNDERISANTSINNHIPSTRDTNSEPLKASGV
jgi:hypothetical protein